MQNWSKRGVNMFFSFQVMSKKLNLDDFFRLRGHTACKALLFQMVFGVLFLFALINFRKKNFTDSRNLCVLSCNISSFYIAITFSTKFSWF